jgi:branched-subunit amino acid transport protein
MSGYDLTIWGVFILIGLATTLPRASFIVLGSRVALPSLVQRALRYAPAAALAAIVVPDILLVSGELAPINPKLAAAVAAIGAALAQSVAAVHRRHGRAARAALRARQLILAGGCPGFDTGSIICATSRAAGPNQPGPIWRLAKPTMTPVRRRTIFQKRLRLRQRPAC